MNFKLNLRNALIFGMTAGSLACGSAKHPTAGATTGTLTARFSLATKAGTGSQARAARATDDASGTVSICGNLISMADYDDNNTLVQKLDLSANPVAFCGSAAAAVEQLACSTAGSGTNTVRTYVSGLTIDPSDTSSLAQATTLAQTDMWCTVATVNCTQDADTSLTVQCSPASKTDIGVGGVDATLNLQTTPVAIAGKGYDGSRNEEDCSAKVGDSLDFASYDVNTMAAQIKTIATLAPDANGDNQIVDSSVASAYYKVSQSPALIEDNTLAYVTSDIAMTPTFTALGCGIIADIREVLLPAANTLQLGYTDQLSTGVAGNKESLFGQAFIMRNNPLTFGLTPACNTGGAVEGVTASTTQVLIDRELDTGVTHAYGLGLSDDGSALLVLDFAGQSSSFANGMTDGSIQTRIGSAFSASAPTQLDLQGMSGIEYCQVLNADKVSGLPLVTFLAVDQKSNLQLGTISRNGGAGSQIFSLSFEPATDDVVATCEGNSATTARQELVPAEMKAMGVGKLNLGDELAE